MAVHGNGSPCEKTQTARKGNMMFQCIKQQAPIHVPTSFRLFVYMPKNAEREKSLPARGGHGFVKPLFGNAVPALSRTAPVKGI